MLEDLRLVLVYPIRLDVRVHWALAAQAAKIVRLGDASDTQVEVAFVFAALVAELADGALHFELGRSNELAEVGRRQALHAL